MRYFPLPALVAILLCLGLNTATKAAEPPSFFNGFEVENGLIATHEIDHGGPGRDGIPALDKPLFYEGDERSKHIKPGDQILGVSYNGIAKAYPISILDYHEIVNDTFGDTPLTVTFCPLCGTGMVFYAEVDDKLLNFGVSGLIYNSDMLLYDRNTQSLWSQIMKKAVTGPLAGSELNQVPAQYTSWKHWLQQHPETLLLSSDTGHTRNYDASPYYDYRRLPFVTFATLHQDTRMPAKTWVVGITLGDDAIALPFTELDKLDKPLAISMGGSPLELQWDKEGAVARVFDSSGTEIPATAVYWFAWIAFHPASQLYQPTD